MKIEDFEPDLQNFVSDLPCKVCGADGYGNPTTCPGCADEWDAARTRYINHSEIQALRKGEL